MKLLCKQFRCGESLLISGFFVIGYLFGVSSFHNFKFLNFSYFFVASYTLVLSYYSFNSFLGYSEDISNSRLQTGGRTSFLWVGIFSGIFAFLLFWIHSPLLLLLALSIFMIAYIYSAFFKYIPFAGTVMHLIAIPFKFNIGYAFVVGNIHQNSLFISLYFGLLFASGHIHHELIDFDADEKNSITSGAVFLGKKKAVQFYVGLTTLSVIYLAILSWFSVVSTTVLMIFGTAFLLQVVVWVFLNRQRGGIANNLLLNRLAYRIFYFSSGVVFAVVSLSV